MLMQRSQLGHKFAAGNIFYVNMETFITVSQIIIKENYINFNI